MNIKTYLLISILTFAGLFAIIVFSLKKLNKKYVKNIYKQSDMHQMLKTFFILDTQPKNSFSSQIKKRKEKQTIKAIVLQDKAYWVANNVFYVGLTKNGKLNPETGMPINAKDLSISEINKLLFILDSLRSGENNDSSSTGH
jgi:hypothetical protein